MQRLLYRPHSSSGEKMYGHMYPKKMKKILGHLYPKILGTLGHHLYIRVCHICSIPKRSKSQENLYFSSCDSYRDKISKNPELDGTT